MIETFAEAATQGINVDRLCGWMDRMRLGSGDLQDIVALKGGTQNILLRFRRAGKTYVLRRPPLKPRPGNDDTMRREARILGALAGTEVPHPGLIGACDDLDVLGVSFYLMQPVDGFNATMGMPSPHRDDPALRRAMGFAFVDGAAALGRLDHAAIGLADFGASEGYLSRQVSRWQGQMARYREEPSWTGEADLPGLDRIAAFLERNVPRRWTPGIIHGDYQIANVMFRNAGPELAAIVDWELATIGDPLIDLGWIVATWPGSGGPELEVLTVTPFDGFPTADELIARYAAGSERHLSGLRWYVVLACYKLAIVLEGTFVRACAGKAPKVTGARLHRAAVTLLHRALHHVG